MIDPADLPPTEPEIPHPGESINPEDATYVPGEVSFADSEPQPGETLRYVGDYEVIGEIARGGMGVVYKARQVTLNRVVALKMLLSGQLAGPDDIARFQTEAQAAAQLDHPGIVPVFEIGRHQSFHYIAMAYIDGRSLAAQVAQGPMQPRDAAELVKTIANAVQYAHERGVIHRDLKPANILIDSAGRPRVTDFGLAKLNQNSSDLTGTGQVLGTPSYMPPEQASGDLKSIAVTADVYSLGAILYCLLVGRPPFQAATIHDTLSQVITQEPVPPRQLNWLVPRDLQTIVLKCLEKHPARRYSTAADLVADLDRFLKGDPILARPVSFAGRMVRQLVKHHKVVAAMVVPVVTLLGAILAYLGYHRWQRCWLTVSGSGMAEIYQNGGTSAVAKFSLPVVEEIAIPSGEYRIRYFGSQEPDETFLLTLRRGVHHAISPPKRERDATSLSLRQREILPKPDPFAAKSDARRVMMSADGMELERWHRLPWTEGSATLLYTSQRASLVVPKRGDSSWDVPFSIPETQNCEVSPHKIGDLTGDGLPDCFFVGTNNSEVFAFLVSGADGQLVWKSTALKLGGQWHGDVICHDLNADGHADALLWIPPSDAVNDVVDDTFVPNCTLVAISGVDGAVLWRHEDAEGAAPVFTKTALGTEIAVATADKVLFLSPASGATSHTLELGFRPIVPPLVGDLDGDGLGEIIAVKPINTGNKWQPVPVHQIRLDNDPPQDDIAPSSRVMSGVEEIVVYSGESGLVSWRQPAERPSGLLGGLGWPWKLQLVHVRNSLEWDLLLNSEKPRLLDGRTGGDQWPPMRAQPNAVFTPTNDLDGDGFRDLVAIEKTSTDMELSVVSGAQGTVLKAQRITIPHLNSISQHFQLSRRHPQVDEWGDALCLYSPLEPDGWPREILFRHNHNAPVYRLSFGSKRPVQSLLVGPIVHLDVEDVGRPQIFGSVSDPIPLRGRTLWKRQGKWLPFGDVNRDGVFDVVGAGGYHSGNAVSGCFGVFSGVDGSCIWMANQPMLYSYSKLRVDVDSDGAPELFGVVRELGVDGSSEARQSVQKTELRAYSGATGKLRWSCLPFRSLDLLWAKDPTKVEIPNLYNASGASGPERTLPVWQLGDLDGDGVAELGASCRLSENGDSDDRTDWICLISGRTGAVLWSRLYTAKERRQSFKRPGFIRFPEGASSGSTNGVLIAEIDYASFGDTRGQLLYLDWKKDREIWSTPLVVEAACESTEPAVDFRERAIQIANLGSTGGPIVLVPVGNGERTEIQLRDFATGAIEQRVSVPHGFPYQSRMSLEFDGARRPLVIGGNDRWESVVWGFEGRPVFSTPNSTAPIPGRLPGREGFVVFAIHGREIVCHDWERNTVLWRRVIPSNIPFDSLIACPSEASTSAILVMARHRDSSLTYFTLDAATGVPRWEFCDVGVQIPNPWEFGAMQSPRYLRANERHPESRCDVTYCHEIPLLGPPEKSSPVHVTP